MKYKVSLYVGGKVFTEEVHANSPKDAKETAQARNPHAKIISVNATFLWMKTVTTLPHTKQLYLNHTQINFIKELLRDYVIRDDSVNYGTAISILTTIAKQCATS